MIYALQIKVIGKVQGVWFRKGTQKKAISLGLRGNVQNLKDNSVLINVQGDKAKVLQLLDWCKIGTTNAKVETVSQKEIEQIPQGDTFVILR